MSPLIIFLTGVSGSGKSTLGHLLSRHTAWPFFDGDDFHPMSNIEKMRSGQPLSDEDRVDWLASIREKTREMHQAHAGAVFACSALREKYRRFLEEGLEGKIQWIFLDGNYEQIARRLASRTGHYMPPSLLQSQFDILEKPEKAFVVKADQSPESALNSILQYLNMTQAFGLIGLGVMGKSLSRNLASKGICLALYNRHVEGLEENVAVDFIRDFPELSQARGFDQVPDFVNSLERPRKILLMVNAGKATDAVIEALEPLLDPGDVLIDAGNTHYSDTERRMERLAARGIHFIGTGVSGGEEGALKGPSIMPGGEAAAYALVRPFLESIAAKDKNGQPCCAHIGKGGSGHFVKMLHNGVEYAEMQLIAEAYFILRRLHGRSPDDIADIFEQWNQGECASYLLEISALILRRREGEGWLLDGILDAASNKGTGAWTTVAAAELGVPATLISEALFSRYLSYFWEDRKKYAELFGHSPKQDITLDTEKIRKAYQLARVVNHHQGIELLSAASKKYDWKLNLPEIARIWTNGCIIRSAYMEQLVGLLSRNAQILQAPETLLDIHQNKNALCETVCTALANGLEIPCLSAALNYLHALSNSDSPMNLIQAQRDYFGAHTFVLRDDPEQKARHVSW